jgi:4-hydroxy-2-oxoheptanedioate aldolase
VPSQLVAAERGGAHTLVRVESTARERTTRALDLGAEGVVCPRVDSAEEAAAWAPALRYSGTRGVALGTRGAGFGLDEGALARADPLGVVQIESARAVEECEAIARVDGVDVLFVGPTDLSFALGCFREWDAPVLREATARVAAAARSAGKVAGTFCASPDQVGVAVRDGFRLVAVSGDVALLGQAARRARSA